MQIIGGRMAKRIWRESNRNLSEHAPRKTPPNPQKNSKPFSARNSGIRERISFEVYLEIWPVKANRIQGGHLI